MSKARDLATRTGLTQIVPTSISVGSGSGSVSANGNVTFTNASSVSIDGIFSSKYTHYAINYELNRSISGGDSTIRFRTASGDDSSYIYILSGYYFTTSGTSGAYGTGTNTVAYIGSGSDLFGQMRITNPASSTKRTMARGEATWSISAQSASHSINMNATTAYSGISFIDGAGGSVFSSGTIQVYGYNNG